MKRTNVFIIKVLLCLGISSGSSIKAAAVVEEEQKVNAEQRALIARLERAVLDDDDLGAVRQLIEHPSLAEQLPDGTEIEFVEKDFSRIEKNKTKKTKARRKYLRVKSELILL